MTVISILAPFATDREFEAALQAAAPDAEIHWTPYMESSEVRSSRGRNGGYDPDGLELPEIDAATREIWQRTTIAFGMDLPQALEEHFPKLEWFQSFMAGIDHMDTAELAGLGIRVTTASGIAAVSIAEFAMARMLQVWKHLRLFDRQQGDHVWKIRYGTEAAGRTMGVVGLGAIGRQVAVRARAFGMTVLATRGSAQRGDTDPDVDELFPAADVDAMLARCDAVVSALPSTTETADMFDAARFAAMKPGVFFCNVGRGVHVVEDALMGALDSGHVAAAALDVTRVEPLPADSPLWDAPNLYLSPHTSVSVDRYQVNAWALALDNVDRWHRNDELRNDMGIGQTP